MNTINLTINNQPVKAQPGDTILKAATRHGIYIPTLCYLKKVKPIASCRICVVEVENVDGFVLSCQAPAREGIVVKTDSDALQSHRRNIMRFYDVNHPLECGVCDKSGECDLQNRTLEMGVEQQNFSAKEYHRKIEDWGFIKYDESLCIVCERCVHTCNQIVGDNALKLVVGGYSSKIARNEQAHCSECGECMAVCPVGALASTDFQYTSNAWELKKIPASCSHCSAACSLNYEVKHGGTREKKPPKISRITSDIHFTNLCGAGRFGYDFENRSVEKNPEAFEKAVAAFKEAGTIVFNSYITNEEAQILQRLKETHGYKLINEEARNYQTFLNAFAGARGKKLYAADMRAVADSDMVMILGTRISHDNPMVKFHANMAQKQNGAPLIYFHPMEDAALQVSKFIKYEVGSEEGVMALLADALLKSCSVPSDLRNYFNGLDDGYLSAESNVGEEEIGFIEKIYSRKKAPVLVVGADLYGHARAENIARMLGFVEKYSDVKVMLTPPATNALGVALINELDEHAEGNVIGYNAAGDYVLSNLGEGDLDMPALNQQEGTFTNVDKRVVPLHVALPYEGYVLNDLANALELRSEWTIDYTSALPQEEGFRSILFDEIEDTIGINGENYRGYELANLPAAVADGSLEEVEDLGEYNGTVIYRCNPQNHLSPFVKKTHQFSSKGMLSGSEQFALAAKISDGEQVAIQVADKMVNKTFKIDATLKGTIAMLPDFDTTLSEPWIFSAYRYSKALIKKAENTNPAGM